MDPGDQHFRNVSSADLAFAEKRTVWLEISDMSGKEFDAMMAEQEARQESVPRVGDGAPGLKLDVFDREKKRIGETVNFSGLRGKPFALLFGSYT